MYENKTDAPNKEAVYVSAYTIIKKMLSDGVINAKTFSRLNERIADRQGCTAFSH